MILSVLMGFEMTVGLTSTISAYLVVLSYFTTATKFFLPI
jgi:hypothetical protein